ncbi:MAG: Holliday junction branch migration protein RuvA [Candidatus Pacebacteria bacterium]|nr:Holliday junction branch migration protein RuvA [Candidatus Paceibacterota bacterium]
MIAYLSGKIISKQDGFIIVLVNGVGYEVWLSAASFESIPEIKGDINLFCQMEANDRGVKLYGFLTASELEFFKIVRNIQGVGPKAALEISGVGPLEKIQAEIEKGNLKFLDGIPNIGAKKAAKVILELSGRIKTNASSRKKAKDSPEDDEAFAALANLGFSKEKIRDVLTGLPKDMPATEKITQALKILGQ